MYEWEANIKIDPKWIGWEVVDRTVFLFP
jgi:hypothetical protein